jgi:hypothetical protein
MGFLRNFEIWSNQKPKVCSFDLEDYAGTYRDCDGITIPTVDNTALECTEFVKTNCIKTSKSYPFFGIANLETLTSALDKIMQKVKAINEKATKSGRGIAVFVQPIAPTQGDFNVKYGSTDGFGVNNIIGADHIQAGDIWIVQ